MIVTIDGPAGAGKSSAARALAARLGFEFLDTGAMYRAVALAARRAGVRWTDDTALAQLLTALRLEMPSDGRVLLDGQDVSPDIRTPEISSGASIVAASVVVRPHLAAIQRSIAVGRDMVCEGRDQGTVVFRDAGCKFYLDADPEERLLRRARELQQKGQPVDLDELRRAQIERDARDSERAHSPLCPADDAVRIDSTKLSAEQVVEVMEREVRRRLQRT